MKKVFIIGLLLITAYLSLALRAQEAAKQPAAPLYIIFDGSNSMWGELENKERKIAVAKDVFKQLDQSLFEGRDVALRLYGHRRAKDCADTELAVPFTQSADVKAKLAKAINAVSPRGRTPITRSLTAALKDFGGRNGEILLISDGIETCDADPCELVQSWQEQNIDIRVHVVGLGLQERARTAMQCISDAAGTDYMDANSTVELSEAIETAASASPLTPGEAGPKKSPPRHEFKIKGVDDNGDLLPVGGKIFKDGAEVSKIQSNARYVFEPGEYTINVGVPTANGILYKPKVEKVIVKELGTTLVTVTLSKPPTVAILFKQKGQDYRPVHSYAYQGEQQVLMVRAGDTAYVMPGDYEFRADVNKDNSNLKILATVAEGQHHELVMQLIETVKTSFLVINKESGKKVRQHQQLWQNGELKYKIHYANGAKIQPGTYTLKSEGVHTPYAIEEVVVPAVDKQVLEFALEFGKAQISYPEKMLEKLESAGKKRDIRCWLYRVDESGKKSANHGRMQKCNGSDIYLSKGRFWLNTTGSYGPLAETYFDIKNGETTVVNVKRQK